MSDLILYNPSLLTREQCVEQFVVRREVLEALIDNLRGPAPSHLLLTGTRGFGKTMVLHRLRFAIRDDVELSARWWPLSFPEEQYNVLQLSDFFLNCLDALADSFEQLQRGDEAARIDARVKALGPRPDSELVRDILIEEAQRLNRTFVLLVDNAERVLDQIETAEEKVLSRLFSRQAFVFIGATSNALAEAFDTGAPFAGFFRHIRLGPLSIEEMGMLLDRLAGHLGSDEVKRWLADSSIGRLTALRLLSGGNPRTIGLLYLLIARGRTGDIKTELDELLDQVTPLYKARLDDQIAAHSQNLFNTIALGWPRTLTAREIAETIGHDTVNVSSQLSRLVKQGILEKSIERDNRTTFQVAERFFNLWYIMRNSRRVRVQIRRYAEFLQVLYDAEQIRAQAEEYVRNLRKGLDPNPWHRFILAAAVETPELKRQLRLLKAKTQEAIPDWLTEAEELIKKRDHKGAEALCREQIAAEPVDSTAWDLLGRLLTDHLQRFTEAEAAFRRAVELDPTFDSAWNRLGNLLVDHLKQPDEALKAYAQVLIIDPAATYALYNTGLAYGRLGDKGEAEIFYRRALQISPHYASAWNGLGYLLQGQPGRMTEAIDALQKSISLDPAMRYPRTNLLQLAGSLARGSDWTLARQLVHDALTAAPETVRPQILDSFITFLIVAVQEGHANECITLLSDAGLSEDWLAVREALLAVINGSQHLDALVPEVHKPAHDIFNRLLAKAK